MTITSTRGLLHLIMFTFVQNCSHKYREDQEFSTDRYLLFVSAYLWERKFALLSVATKGGSSKGEGIILLSLHSSISFRFQSIYGLSRRISAQSPSSKWVCSSGIWQGRLIVNQQNLHRNIWHWVNREIPVIQFNISNFATATMFDGKYSQPFSANIYNENQKCDGIA